MGLDFGRFSVRVLMWTKRTKNSYQSSKKYVMAQNSLVKMENKTNTNHTSSVRKTQSFFFFGWISTTKRSHFELMATQINEHYFFNDLALVKCEHLVQYLGWDSNSSSWIKTAFTCKKTRLKNELLGSQISKLQYPNGYFKEKQNMFQHNSTTHPTLPSRFHNKLAVNEMSIKFKGTHTYHLTKT